MKTIDADIKSGEFSQVYLLYGEESYLMKQYRDKLKLALVPEDDSMNVSLFEGKDILPSEVIGMAETMPFFAERRLVLVEDSKFFKNSVDELADYVKSSCPTTCMVFVESEVDKRSRMYKSVKAAGRIVEFPRQTEAILSKWVQSRLKKEGKSIQPSVLHQFLADQRNDMEHLDRELEKLFSYTVDKDVIEKEDIEAICVYPITNRIFDMINALAGKNREKVMEYYRDLLALKEAPMRILFLLSRQFRILMVVKDMQGKGYDNSFIASHAGIPPFAVRRNVEQARHFSMTQLREALKDCVETEEAVKTGNLNDRMGVEILLVKYSG